MRARMVLTLAALAAILSGFSALGEARADSSRYLRLVPANAMYRALVGESSPAEFPAPQADDEDRALTEAEMAAMPSLPELPELPEQPTAQPSALLATEKLPVELPLPAEEESTEPESEELLPEEALSGADGGFEYDAELMLEPELPLDDLRSEPAQQQSMLEEPMLAEELLPEMLPEVIEEELPSGERSLLNRTADEFEPVMPLPRFTLPPDPFFGSVAAMLGASGPQSVIPLAAVRPPAPARYFNGQWMNLDPWGAPTKSIDELARITSGQPLDLNTSGAGDFEGRAVLLVAGRALKLRVLEWTDSRVNLDLPQLSLTKPMIARVYIADASGTVQDYADFMLE